MPAQLDALLPGVRSEWLKSNPLRGAITSLIAGIGKMGRLRFTPDDGRAPVTVTLPVRDDLMPDAIAAAVETTLAVHARFGHIVDVRALSFSLQDAGMIDGSVSGSASRIGGEVTLNANHVVSAWHERWTAWREEKYAGIPEQARSHKPKAPWTEVHGVMAHELWHKIEIGWSNAHYAESVEYRRRVGALIGLETIEQMNNDWEARKKLALGVSGYAAKNHIEATAEMFEMWWCGPPAAGSLPAQFGEIVEVFFPDK